MNHQTLADKTLIMLVGPSAVGKSTLMNQVVSQFDDYSYVRSFTTRKQRPGETSHYNFISREQAQLIRQNRQAITYVEHPTTPDIYGTTEASFPNRFNLLDTLSGSVQGYRDLPFKNTVTISLTASTKQWHQWFLSRYPKPSPEAEKRLAEAALSINWSLSDDQTYWLNNPQSELTQTAQKLASIVRRQATPLPKAPAEPYAMLELIERGVWHNQ